MSNLSELIEAISKSDTSAVNVSGALFGTLADFSGAFGFVQLGANVIEQLLGHDEDVQRELATIVEKVTELKALIAAQGKLDKMNAIDGILRDAYGVFEALPATLADPGLSDDFRHQQVETCLTAALGFQNEDDKWKAPWLALPYYYDAYSGKLAPQADADGLVFDYTYTLPQYLRSIYFLITALGALVPNNIDLYRDPLVKIRGRLSWVHDTIVAGIINTRAPGSADTIGMVTIPELPDRPTWSTAWNAWDVGLWPYGAVETYSGASAVSSYFADFKFAQIDMGQVSRDVEASFLDLVQLRFTEKRKTLYKQVGLPVVRQIVEYLGTITGVPPLNEKHYEDWGIRELLEIVPGPVRGSLRSTLSIIEMTPPYGTYWAFGLDPDNQALLKEVSVPGQKLPAGLRDLLVA